MPRRKKDSPAGFRNGQLFCFNCGISFDMQLPQPTRFAAELMKLFDKTHANCEKTWMPPVVDQSLSAKQKADWWKTGMNGERGSSSEAMCEVLYTDNPIPGLPHPSDVDDFRRCYLLLQTVPEWKEKLYLMKGVSPTWSKLVDNWDKLTQMLEQVMAGNKQRANEMHEFMKSLGC